MSVSGSSFAEEAGWTGTTGAGSTTGGTTGLRLSERAGRSSLLALTGVAWTGIWSTVGMVTFATGASGAVSVCVAALTAG
jgi:hypothetical protein